MVLFGGVWSGTAASEVEDSLNRVWNILHNYETQAIHDYEHHLFSNEIRQRGEELWQVARSKDFLRRRNSCGAAAETLSYMVTGYYDSRVRREIALDWLHYAKNYLEYRSACLNDLKLDESRYPLPFWFGR